MDDKNLNSLYVSAVRSRKKSGARWQAAKSVHAGEAREFASELDGREEKLPVASVPTIMRNLEIETEVKGRVRQLIDLSKQILTERQYAVFVLMVVKDPALTERETAKVLGISPGRVHQLWETARQKLGKAYETRTAA